MRRYWQAPRLRLLKNVGQNCLPHHAVLIAPGLRLGSAKNGNISYVGWRLSAISRSDCANWRDREPIHKKPQFAGTYRNNRPTLFSCFVHGANARWRAIVGVPCCGLILL